MELTEIQQKELTADERTILAEDALRWKPIGDGQHLDDWLAFGPGLMIRRKLAMRLAYVNEPKGRGYNEVFAQLMKQDGLDTMEKTSVSAVLWLHDDPKRLTLLQEIRAGMTAGERSRLNSPITARQRIEKLLKVHNGTTEEMPTESSVAKYKRRIEEQDREIAVLRERIARASDESLFDLRRDTVENIAQIIIKHGGPGRAENIARAIRVNLKAVLKPAG